LNFLFFFTAIGAGALGSHLIINLTRAGFGTWTIIDEDRLMPHNLARHTLDGFSVGYSKAEMMALTLESILAGEKVDHITADVLAPGKDLEKVEASLDAAELILDLSASIAVPRHLAAAPRVTRCASLFMNSDGRDLVLLAEDADRSLPLDVLEMQYYRASISDIRLQGHLSAQTSRVRYGQGCRDVAATLPQSLVALHAAVGSRAVESLERDSGAKIVVWRADETSAITRFDLAPVELMRADRGEGWTLITDTWLLDKLTQTRQAKLPRETGGVLIGRFDVDRRRVYVVDSLLSPRDSVEKRSLYIRGKEGLQSRVTHLEQQTDRNLGYVGEWHSHPPHHSARPSRIDLKHFSWLEDRMSRYALPPVLIIIGKGGQVSAFVAEVVQDSDYLIRDSVDDRE